MRRPLSLSIVIVMSHFRNRRRVTLASLLVMAGVVSNAAAQTFAPATFTNMRSAR